MKTELFIVLYLQKVYLEVKLQLITIPVLNFLIILIRNVDGLNGLTQEKTAKETEKRLLTFLANFPGKLVLIQKILM